ncbi:MAG: DUF2057 domain-containing protein [Acinetobacter populi]|jgi:uncharacterized protein YccT (UPF0319 family)|uniref:DUF2057 family protein n=1 Tax=Acinetobacter populi TaxID=1582270 RepID=UPI00235397FC|nr:DUF2057 family protein [Acinetobacter populi]MCH4247393.1 DUF2057 domain-containing protein [Acinetobacter populi]
MFKQGLIALVLGSVSFSALAAVIVEAPEEIVVVAIDDQEVGGSIFRGKLSQYKIDAGQHSISVKYQEIFNHNDGEHDVLKSNIVTLNQLELKDGQTYQLTLVNAPKTFEDGQKFAEQPVIGLKDAKGQLIAQQAGATSKSKPWLSQGIFGSILDLRQKDDKNTNPNQSSMIQPASTQPVATATTVSTAATTTVQGSKDQQLIELWKSATPNERQRFMAWLTEQASK